MRKLIVVMMLVGASALLQPRLADADKKAGAGVAEQCPQACQHRRECKIAGSADVAACTAECQSVASLYTAQGMSGYVAAKCTTVKAAEAAFRGAVACHSACRHRAECVAAASDVAGCTSTCATLGYPKATLEQYTASSCKAVAKLEPEFQAAQTCLYSCAKVVDCGVKGDLRTCFGMCTEAIANAETTVADIAAVQQQSCPWIKQNISITRPRRSGGSISLDAGAGMSCTGGGASCQGVNICCAHGESAAQGQSGMCMSPPICYMPRR